MFDIFYSGKKPGLFAHEHKADSIEHAQQLSRTRYFWWVHYLADLSQWNWLWEPVPWQSHQRHAWPSQHQPDSGIYLVPKSGYTETNYRTDAVVTCLSDQSLWTIPDSINIEQFDFSWHPDYREPLLNYQFGTQHQRTGGPLYQRSDAADVKYINQPRATKITRDDICWIVPEGIDKSSFDWTWHPDANDPPYIYQFGTQHQRTGGPKYVVHGASEIKYVDQIRIRTQRIATAIYEIDHLDGNAGKIPNAIKTVRYFDNYLDTLRRLSKSIPDEHEFVWICSSICNYDDFDFSWHPEQWQATMLHVFQSNGQKFGDTFFMHVPTFKYRADQCKLLEWYSLNFVDQFVPRRSMPVIEHTSDSQVEAVKNTEWAGPLALFTTNGVPITIPTVPLWRQETKTIVSLSAGASTVIVPKVAKGSIKTQLYDYPYIDKTNSKRHSDEPLDIVFISNGENDAEYLFNRLHGCITDLQPNRLVRVENVKGRVAAYQAAARVSTTPWFFAVFGKLEVDLQFPWDWQPDRMQQPKHYIFHAENPINGLVYGHQAMIAYNKKLVLENTGRGLDFTLDQEHEVVPILSGTANYHTSDWMCWRTAFREALKLRASLPDVENEYRLNQWLTVDAGVGQWSSKGAQDAIEYYDEVGGDFAELKKSYEWDWLSSYAFLKRGLAPNQ